MRSLFCETKDKFFVLNEDIVGWYLIVYKDKTKSVSIEDHLLDSYEDAIDFAKEDFNISKTDWKEES